MMQINAVDLINEDIPKTTVSNNPKTYEANFNDLMKNEIAKIFSVDDFKVNLEKKYNANISYFSGFFDESSITGLNNVIISRSTLEKMMADDNFCKKIMKIIDDFCSYDSQMEIKGLAPPVKSAGVIIKPDGSCLYWLESIYSDREVKTKYVNKTDSINNYTKMIEEINNSLESVLNFSDMVGIGAVEEKKSSSFGKA